MRQCLRRAAGVCLAVVLTITTAREVNAGWIVVDSINESANPAFYTPGSPAVFTWAATDVGWFYTPNTTYDLWQIATKFASADGRNVTVDIYNASKGPGGALLSPAPGDSPLRSAVFAPQTDAFAGGIFTPLPLTAGNTYFFEFENVQGLGVNVTADNGATSLAGGLRYSFSNGSYWWSTPGPNLFSQPIVQFLTDPPAVPEPSTLVLFGIGSCVTLAGAAWRRRREKRAAA